jgi:hypothetical protein
VSRDRLFQLEQAHQGVTEAGEGHSEIRLERNGALLNSTRLLIALLAEQRETEIRERFDVARLGRDRLRQSLLGEIRPAGIERRHAKQVQRVKMVGHEPHDLSANRLRLGVLACAIGGNSQGHQLVGLLATLLLQPRVLQRAQTDRALQGQFSERAFLANLARLA